ncbi:MAG: hypothetical protein WC533_01610 [Candidatus Pacearchaeota archaeon]
METDCHDGINCNRTDEKCLTPNGKCDECDTLKEYRGTSPYGPYSHITRDDLNKLHSGIRL